MDRVVHFEIPVNDLDAAKRFYGDVFGWGLTDFADGQEYVLATTAEVGPDYRPTEAGAINGALMRRRDDAPAPVVVIDVGSVDAAPRARRGRGRLGGAAAHRDPQPRLLRVRPRPPGERHRSLGGDDPALSGTPGQPVEPKPPSPRPSEGGSSSTATAPGSPTGTTTSWAMRSPGSIRWTASPRLTSTTSSSPR